MLAGTVARRCPLSLFLPGDTWAEKKQWSQNEREFREVVLPGTRRFPSRAMRLAGGWNWRLKLLRGTVLESGFVARWLAGCRQSELVLSYALGTHMLLSHWRHHKQGGSGRLRLMLGRETFGCAQPEHPYGAPFSAYSPDPASGWRRVLARLASLWLTSSVMMALPEVCALLLSGRPSRLRPWLSVTSSSAAAGLALALHCATVQAAFRLTDKSNLAGWSYALGCFWSLPLARRHVLRFSMLVWAQVLDVAASECEQLWRRQSVCVPPQTFWLASASRGWMILCAMAVAVSWRPRSLRDAVSCVARACMGSILD